MATATRRLPPSEPFYRAAYLRPLLAIVRARGIDPAPLLARAGYAERDFDDPGACLPFRRTIELCEAIRRAVRDPRLAVEWGLRMNEHAHGLAGIAVITAPTVAKALATIDAVSMLRSTTIRGLFQHGPQSSRLSIVQIVPLGASAEFIQTPVALMNAQLLRLILGDAASRLSVELPFRAPCWRAEAERHFGCAVRFGRPQIAFEIPTACLERPNPMADAESHAVAVRQCQLERQRLSRSRRHGVARHLAEHIEASPTSSSTAAALCRSERTLRRELQAEGTSFREILNAVRMDAACSLLEASAEPVERIAWRLGYGESANFVRAFRRHVGMTPEQYRRSR